MLGGSGHGGGSDRADLAIVIVSTNEAHWLEQCLPTVFEHAGGATLEVIVVDNSSTDGTRELVESRFPQARVVSFGQPRIRVRQQSRPRTGASALLLLLNPDTEVVAGTFGELVGLLDDRPTSGSRGSAR